MTRVKSVKSFKKPLIRKMGITIGSPDIGMAEHFLNDAEICSMI